MGAEKRKKPKNFFMVFGGQNIQNQQNLSCTNQWYKSKYSSNPNNIFKSDYFKKISIKINGATEEVNSQNKT